MMLREISIIDCMFSRSLHHKSLYMVQSSLFLFRCGNQFAKALEDIPGVEPNVSNPGL